jgi:large subunit ribosomal protein L25
MAEKNLADRNAGGMSAADRAGTSKKATRDDSNRITADLRHAFGKGAARKLRATGRIPAVVYGHGTEPRHLALPGHEVALLLRKANAVLDIDIEGVSQLALVKDVQKDPVRQIIEHIDLIVVRRGEKVTVDVNVHVLGESAPETLVNLDAPTISLEVEATHIPESVSVDIEGLEEGVQILAKDITLPAGAVLVTEPDTLVVGIAPALLADLGESETEDEEGEGAEIGESDEAAAEREAEDAASE